MIWCRLNRKKIYYWQEGWLDNAHTLKIEAHLRSCHRCRQWLEYLRQVTAGAKENTLQVDETFWEAFDRKLCRLVSQTGTSDAKLPKLRIRLVPLRFKLAVAALAAFVVIASVMLPRVLLPRSTLLTDSEVELVSLLLNQGDDLAAYTDEDILEEALLLIRMGASPLDNG